jgi:hypothetical protein
MLLWCVIILMVMAAGLAFFFRLVKSHDFFFSNESEIYDHKKEQFTLPTGEIVSNDSWMNDEDRENHLVFRENATAPAQPLNTTMHADADNYYEIAVKDAKLFRYGDRQVLVIDPFIFVSDKSDPETQWKSHRFLLENGTMDYLENFCPPSNKYYPQPAVSDVLYRNIYHFDHLEDDGRTLFLSRDANGAPYPQFLVYHMSKFRDWEFDFDATIKADKFSSPKDPGLIVDVSVVEYTGDPPISPDDVNPNFEIRMDLVLARPGAAKVYDQSYPLPASGWVSCEGDFPYAAGKTFHQDMQLRFGFWNLKPDYLSVFLKGDSTYADPYRLIKLGQWQEQNVQRYEGSVFETFYRVRQTSDPGVEYR